MPRFSLLARPAFLAAAVLAGGVASAQTTWRTVPEGASVSFDVLRSFEGRSVVTDEFGREVGDVGPTALNTAQVLSTRVPVGSRSVLVADLPFSYARFANPDVPALETRGGSRGASIAVGNLYLGARGRPDPCTNVTVRVPASGSRSLSTTDTEGASQARLDFGLAGRARRGHGAVRGVPPRGPDGLGPRAGTSRFLAGL